MGLLLLLGSSGYDVRSQLFAAGEAGAWYDPSDLSSMWQDAAGNTPVTATSDPVGLILDKSRSAPSMGANQITNGGFATDSGWTKGTGWSIGSGVATKAAGSASALSQAQTITAGRYYIITYTATRTAGSFNVQFTGGSTVAGTLRSTSGTFTDIITAVSGNNAFEINTDASFAGTIDNVSVKVLPAGNHAYQDTSGSRPSLNISSGLYALSFDGSDDFLRTNAVDFSATDKISVLAAARKLDTTARMICELGPSLTTSAGSFYFLSGQNATDGWWAASRGTAASVVGHATSSSSAAAETAVVSMNHNISGDLTAIRKNGVAGSDATADKGAGNFRNDVLYIGRRAGTSLPFNGLLYQMVVRGALTSGGTLSNAERYLAQKSGVSI